MLGRSRHCSHVCWIAQETRNATGTDFYTGGWIDPRGGHLQPLSYVRELARRRAPGRAIFAHSAASRSQKANGTLDRLGEWS